MRSWRLKYISTLCKLELHHQDTLIVAQLEALAAEKAGAWERRVQLELDVKDLEEQAAADASVKVLPVLAYLGHMAYLVLTWKRYPNGNENSLL